MKDKFLKYETMIENISILAIFFITILTIFYNNNISPIKYKSIVFSFNLIVLSIVCLDSFFELLEVKLGNTKDFNFSLLIKFMEKEEKNVMAYFFNKYDAICNNNTIKPIDKI